MATRNVNYNGIDMDAYNRWTAEFNVSSRYVCPSIHQDRHYFDASVYAESTKKVDTFYYKFVRIVKSIF
jgi:hypothetical protein